VRWIHAGDSERRETSAAIDAFWAAFAEDRERIAAVFGGERALDLPAWMSRHLHRVHPGILWEYGPAVRGPGHRLVVTPEGAHELRPLVDEVVRRAPTLDGWEFHGHRLAESADQVGAHVRARTGVDLGDAKVSLSVEPHGLLGITVHVPSIGWGQREQVFGAAMVAVETLLGEQVLDRWVGPIDVVTLAKKRGWGFGERAPEPDLLPLRELPARVAACVGDQLAARPAEPLRDGPEVEWVMFRLEPVEAEDYSAQRDLLVAKTMAPEVWKATHSPFPFWGERFSAWGERFVYLKMEDAEREDRVDHKGRIEDALMERLGDTGCVIGGGTGIRYSYIDLALREGGLEAVREVLAGFDMPRRAWVLFFDTELRGEWIGLRRDTPSPPGE